MLEENIERLDLIEVSVLILFIFGLILGIILLCFECWVVLDDDTYSTYSEDVIIPGVICEEYKCKYMAYFTGMIKISMILGIGIILVIILYNFIEEDNMINFMI